MAYQVTLIEGDGIGPEIMAATRRVLEATNVRVEFDHQVAGAGAIRSCGHPLPAKTVESLQATGVGLKGPLIVERGASPVRVESGQMFATPNAALRGVCEAFANVRPAKRFAGVPGRYRDLGIDLVMVREVSEGIYIAQERVIEQGRAEAVLLTTRLASERIVRFAMELACREKRQKVTAIHKANVLDKTDGLFLNAFYDVAKSYSHLLTDDLLVDFAAAKMVLDPTDFDVIVAPNQYGDILSDISAAVVGGLGLGPGANFGRCGATFEACHGAAPDIAGFGIANPIALVLSAAMMLDHLKERQAATRICNAVARVFDQADELTPDLGGTGTTDGVAERIIRLMEQDA